MDPRHLELWYIVRAAQKVALRTARRGTRARDVDKAAREVIKAGIQEFRTRTRERRTFLSPHDTEENEKDDDEFDVNDYFTHRLGHGESSVPFSER